MTDGIQQFDGATTIVPVFPLPNTVFFPHTSLPLHIFEPRYRDMVRDALAGDRRFGMVYHDWDEQGPFLCEEGRIGCVAEIREHELLDDGRSVLVVEGMQRFRIVDGIESHSLYFEGLVTPHPDTTAMSGQELQTRRGESIRLFRDVVATLSDEPFSLPDLDPADEVSFVLARSIEIGPGFLQRLLELTDEGSRLVRIDRILRAAVQ